MKFSQIDKTKLDIGLQISSKNIILKHQVTLLPRFKHRAPSLPFVRLASITCNWVQRSVTCLIYHHINTYKIQPNYSKSRKCMIYTNCRYYKVVPSSRQVVKSYLWWVHQILTHEGAIILLHLMCIAGLSNSRLW